MIGLQARAVSHAYGTRQALRQVSFVAAAGQVVGLIGPNGSGKTTLMRCLAGLLPCQGEVIYGDDPLSCLSARGRAERRAFVAQQVDTPFPYRVEEVVAMGLAHHSLLYSAPHAPARVAAALAEVHFDADAQRAMPSLSGGERQQVFVARALVQNSPLLLLDEPTSALDLRHRAAILSALRQRARRGATVMLSLHDLNLAALGCDALLLLAEGRALAFGPPAQVLVPALLAEAYGVGVVCGQHPHRAVPTVELDPGPWNL